MWSSEPALPVWDVSIFTASHSSNCSCRISTACQGPALASSADGWAKEGSEKESGIGTMFGHVETLLSRLRCHSVRMK